MGFLRGRLVSFACALVAAFLFNRRYRFAEAQKSPFVSRPSLWLQWGRPLAALAPGSLLNLASYWLVLKVVPHFPALFALAVAAGWLVSPLANYALTQGRVFIQGLAPSKLTLPSLRIELSTARCLVLVQAVFWISHLTEMALPGLYMDAVNPDYLAARALNPELPNWVGLQPTLGLPILGSLYHGVQNFYVGLPVFALLGFNMLALRVAQGLFASGILVMTQLVLQRASGSLSLALAGALGVATELAFIGSFRTQMYIVMSGAFWLLPAIYLALGRRTSASVQSGLNSAANIGSLAALPMRPWFFSGVCAGLAVYSYFVYLFFVPVFVAMGWWHTRNTRSVLIWLAGFVLGMQTYVLGYTLGIAALGGLEPALEWFRNSTAGLGPLSSVQTLLQRAVNALQVTALTLQNGGNELMIFGTAESGRWALLKVLLLVAAPLLLVALGAVQSWKRRGPAAAEQRNGFLASWHLALMPIMFVAASMIFGDRLWSHHFSPLIPLTYVVLFLLIYHLQTAMRRSLPNWAGVTLMLGFLVGNLYQQQVFFDRLDATGGTKYFSNAINRMADDALSMPIDVVHVFPEWGFAMPFALLTGNHRRYEIDIEDANLQRLAEAGSSVRLYYWQPETQSSYRDKLEAHGYRISGNGVYLQRDQGIAFYWMDALAVDRTK
jgi:hypothetical protein